MPTTDNVPHVLIVEDEPPMRRLLRLLLEGEGYRVTEAAKVAEARLALAQHVPDLVVLDLGLPDDDGMVLLKEVRSWYVRPILVLSAREREADKVRALDDGADDYLTKPFGSGEFLARVRVALRNAGPGAQESPVYLAGGLEVRFVERRVLRDGEPVALTPTEFRLLTELCTHAGKVLTHRHLLKHVWGPESTSRTHYVRVFIAALRRKLEERPARPRWILTEPGIGYRMVPPDD